MLRIIASMTAMACLALPCALALAADTALGDWLPKADSGFSAWDKGLAVRVSRQDYFACGTHASPALPKYDLHYAGSACALLKNATTFVYGSAEPIKGSIVYDARHGVVLFNTGCCAWRGYVLAAGTGAPPARVAGADLSGVRTARGIALGMPAAQVIRIYGNATAHPSAKASLTALYYTTMRGTPKDSPDPCGQHETFFFRNDRLVEIDLLAGC